MARSGDVDEPSATSSANAFLSIQCTTAASLLCFMASWLPLLLP